MQPNTRRRFRPGPRSAAALLLATLLPAACAESRGADPAGRLPERSAGDQALLALGSALDNPAQEFSRVVGAALLGDSAVLVASAGTHDMRLFDLSGSLRLAYGGDGEGPGENRGLGRIFVDGDSVWTFDVLLKRLDLWSLEDGYASSITMPVVAGEPVWTVLGVFADGSVLGSSSPRPETEGGGTTDRHVDLVRWRPGSAEPMRLGTALWDRTFTVLQPNGSTGFSNPFSENASIAVTGDAYWYTDGRSAALRKYSMSGEPLATVQLPFELDPVSGDDRSAFETAWMEGSHGQGRQLRQAVLDGAVFPETFPAITDLVVGKDGSLWAGRYVRDGQPDRVWFVASSEGALEERVLLPADLRLYDVVDGKVVGVRRDEMGVEQVIVYELGPIDEEPDR